MKKLVAVLCTALYLQSASAAFTQVTIEAEQVAGGTITSDLDASGGSTVKRTSEGIYVWWQADTSALSTGSYSVYARMALSAAGTTSANFGPQIFYGTTNLVNLSAVVTNHAYAWIRIGSFDLPQIGGTLRISDWSTAGISVDKLAIVKDVVVEAELASGGTIITDTSASAGRAVTLAAPGNYSWWLPSQAEMTPGDYIVQALLASTDGAAHNFGEVVALDNVTSPTANASVSSTAYQWVSLNSFVNAGGAQSVRISDYSEGKLKLDKVRLVRRTPYEKMSAAQSLYASGAAALGPREQVTFNGVPNGLTALKDPGRVSIVQANATTIYAYFRQEFTPGTFKIFMATSTDGGKTFTVNPAPLIQAPTALGNIGSAYDQHVTKKADGYYMVFEASVSQSNFCAAAAYSPDGVNNWVVKNTPICPNGTASLGASVPNYYTNVETGQQYIQWATVNVAGSSTRRYQYTLPNGLFTGSLQFSQASQIASYAFPQAASAWESNNNSAGSTLYEDGYYYQVYDGSTNYDCNGRWGLGVTRSNTPATLSSWSKSAKNPFMQAQNTTSCWIQYPDLVALPGGTYLYYQNNELNYGSAQAIYRNLITTN
jgi:hypothetical protein